MRKAVVILIALILVVSAGSMAQTVSVADGFQFPVDNYAVTGYWFGDPNGGDGVHVGEDCGKNPGTPIKAIANGEVKLVKTDSQGYEQVVVIEHTLPSGEKVCSIYGHLSERPGYPLTTVGPIDIGDIVGYVGWDDENGIGGPHLHLGIRKGAYVGLYEGRAPDTSNFYGPSDFIADNPVAPSMVGYFGPGDRREPASTMIIQKYNDMAADDHPLGDPWQNPDGGWTAYAHYLNGMVIQDFKDLRDEGGPSNGYYNPYTAIIYKDDDPWYTRHPRLLKEGFWDVWMNQTEADMPGWEVLGLPVTNEMNMDGYVYQRFWRLGDNYDSLPNDYDVFYLRWDPVGQELRVEDEYHNPVDWAQMTVEDGTSKKAMATASSDGVYHSGMRVASLGTPFDLVNGDSYDGFYAVIGGENFAIDPFTMSGNMIITVGGSGGYPPGAGFNIDRYIANIGETVNFTDDSVNNPTVWYWVFGDGHTSSQQHPSHSYSTPGVYSVTLTVSNSYGSDSYTWNDCITIYDPSALEARFTANVTSGNAPLTVNFFDQSVGNPDWWYWDFGDGSTTTGRNVSHTYSTAGTYTVMLMVTNPAASDVETKEGYITVTNGSVTASFYHESPDGYWKPATVNFTDASSGSPAPTSWVWDFGNGHTSTERNPTQTYLNWGDYTVSLTVSNGTSSDTYQTTLHIKEQVTPEFVASRTTGTVPFTVTFEDLSYGGLPESWAWDTGDGGNYCCDQDILTHTYTTPGVYSVRLDVCNGDHCDYIVLTDYITVLDNPLEAIFLASPTSGDAPLSVQFTDHSTGTPTSWNWDFGDGGTSTEQNPIHVYTAPGVYDVYLTVSDGTSTHEGFVLQYIVVNPSVECVLGVAPAPYVHRVAVSGNYAYTVNTGLQIVDISDPAAPVNKGYTGPFGEVYGLAVSGSYVYLAEYLGLLHVVDVSDPMNPVASEYADCYRARDICSAGSYLYAVAEGKLLVIDVSDPANPALAASLDTSSNYPRGVFASGNYVYTVDYYGALRIFDVSDPAAPTLAGSFNTSGNAFDVHVSGGHAYVAAGGSMKIIDVSDPAHSSMVGSVGSSETLSHVFVDGDLAYMPGRAAGLQIVDVYDPTAPVIIGWVGAADSANDVVVDNNYIYMADWNAGLAVVEKGCGTFLTANFGVDVSTGLAPLTVHFTDRSWGNPLSILWDFGDGVTSSEQNPQHTYADPGNYTVSLMVSDSDSTDTKTVVDCITVRDATSGVGDGVPVLTLYNNHPNPFNPQTVISYHLPSSQRVRLVIYDVRGRPIATLVDGVMPEGRHEAIWRGKNNAGQTVGSGVYFYRLTTAQGSFTHKMMLVK